MKHEADFGPYATALDIVDWLGRIAPGLDLKVVVEHDEDEESFTISMEKA